MEQKRGILYLDDPLNSGGKRYMNRQTTLVFDENGRYLSRAQAALYAMRRENEWVCVAAQGAAAAIALALAAQLPVDRLALIGDGFSRRGYGPAARELDRLRGFARRNLSLIIADTLLIDVPKGQIRMLMRGMPHSRFCIFHQDVCPNRICRPWDHLCENSLPIPGNCV